MADRLRGAEGVTLLNDVVLNQVLVRFAHGGADLTRRRWPASGDGVCWVGGTTWTAARGQRELDGLVHERGPCRPVGRVDPPRGTAPLHAARERASSAETGAPFVEKTASASCERLTVLSTHVIKALANDSRLEILAG